MAAVRRRTPQEINQFNRLIETAPGQFIRGSRWNNIRFVNGHNHNFDAENCMAGGGAVMIDAHTNGRITSSPPQIRNAQYDFSGGIGLEDVAIAWKRLWDETLLIPKGLDWNEMLVYARSGRFIGLAVDYDYVPREFQEQKGGSFDHWLGIGSVYADGALLRYDTLGLAARKVPQYAVRAAAEAYALRVRGTKASLVIGMTNVQAPLPVPDPDTNYRMGGKPVGRGRYVARKAPVIPVRSSPSQNAAVVSRMKPGDDFACRQTADRSAFPGGSYQGNARWRGTADGLHWVNDALLWYAGPGTGKEDVR